MSTATLVTALRAHLRPLGTHADAPALEEFVAAVRAEPRRFGARRTTPRRDLDVSRLLHPSTLACTGAFVGDHLAGVAHLSLGGAGGGADPGPARFDVIVRPPWRRSGLGAKLLRTLTLDRGLGELERAVAHVTRDNRAALALARTCGLDRQDLDEQRVELAIRFGGRGRALPARHSVR
jgi:GNAT superfamily N-acetyltransferase